MCLDQTDFFSCMHLQNFILEHRQLIQCAILFKASFPGGNVIDPSPEFICSVGLALFVA